MTIGPGRRRPLAIRAIGSMSHEGVARVSGSVPPA
jgi:hypothetical protein